MLKKDYLNTKNTQKDNSLYCCSCGIKISNVESLKIRKNL